jgi:hypothetical protein
VGKQKEQPLISKAAGYSERRNIFYRGKDHPYVWENHLIGSGIPGGENQLTWGRACQLERL